MNKNSVSKLIVSSLVFGVLIFGGAQVNADEKIPEVHAKEGTLITTDGKQLSNDNDIYYIDGQRVEVIWDKESNGCKILDDTKTEIKNGEEVLTDYEWNPETMKEVNVKMSLDEKSGTWTYVAEDGQKWTSPDDWTAPFGGTEFTGTISVLKDCDTFVQVLTWDEIVPPVKEEPQKKPEPEKEPVKEPTKEEPQKEVVSENSEAPQKALTVQEPVKPKVKAVETSPQPKKAVQEVKASDSHKILAKTGDSNNKVMILLGVIFVCFGIGAICLAHFEPKE
ncbi:LPXTG cell wall anchor domain containing protein [Listeria phage LP-037]|uniref:LPXTG cell wall anchor domain containing protein n=1 Tax=Listeria phage LP-037 TaxID=1173747 RepID=S4UCN9_9CAUD|nr:LPXTG cell wall anchor domain containing protein [Listeria phage LP-037]AGI11666.1 LPXTG cell wall anchor domain containing protein [Listeria phage LP-037]